MSSDLLAEFDSFYNPSSSNPPTNPTPASHDLSFFGSTPQQGQNGQGGGIGGGAQWQSHPTQSNDDIWGGMNSFQSSTNPAQPNTAQDDIWGSFEEAEPVKPVSQSFAPAKPNYGGFTANNQSRQEAGIVRRSTLDLFSSNTYNDSIPNRPNQKPERMPPIQAAPAVTSPGDVLFDAAEELSAEPEDDDDFGDFETFTSPEPPPPPKPQVPAQAQPSQSLDLMFSATSLESKPKSSKRPKDLLSSSMNASNLPYPQAPKSPSFQERNPFGSLGLSMNQVAAVKKEEKPKSASPVTAWPSFQPPPPDLYRDSPIQENQADDDWGDFADLPPETPAEVTSKPAPGIEADAWAWDAADQVVTSPPPPASSEPPPSNIPPPSVLLTLFPPLFDLPRTTLFNPTSTQPFPLKNRILSDPTTLSFLRSYLLIAVVAGHVLAGRKQRWKRDTLLSQAMRIGPAGGKGGMKLTGVDKAEVTREDREANDVVRVWKEQLGRLRSAVAVANSSVKDSGAHLLIPDIGDNMQVKTEQGGLTAPKQCVVCGLKREERVVRVDVGVEDSFGEWWVEHWGHRTCKNFWQEHEGKLKHR